MSEKPTTPLTDAAFDNLLARLQGMHLGHVHPDSFLADVATVRDICRNNESELAAARAKADTYKGERDDANRRADSQRKSADVRYGELLRTATQRVENAEKLAESNGVLAHDAAIQAAAVRAALANLLPVAEDAVNRLYDLGEVEYPAGNVTELTDAVAALASTPAPALTGCPPMDPKLVMDLACKLPPFDLTWAEERKAQWFGWVRDISKNLPPANETTV